MDAKGNVVFTKKDVRFVGISFVTWHQSSGNRAGQPGAAGSAVPRGQRSSSIRVLVLCVIALVFWAAASEHLDCEDQELELKWEPVCRIGLYLVKLEK